MPIDNRQELEDTPLTDEVPAMDYCVRCWVPIYNEKRVTKLWCNHCKKYVDDEIYWWKEHPFYFYFKYHQSCNKSNVKDAESE